MVYGAAAFGARAMTSSSSPGISLKMETISHLAAARLPAVIVNVQRGGPGLGNISASQADYFQAVKGGGHGDYHMLVLASFSVQELWDMTMTAFDKADEYRISVMILTDGVMAQMMEPMMQTPYVRPRLPDVNRMLRTFTQRCQDTLHGRRRAGGTQLDSAGYIPTVKRTRSSACRLRC